MTPQNTWTVQRICQLIQAKFRKRACLFQIKIALALHEKKDVVAIAATGFGKTLSFWIPLLMVLEDGENKCIIIVTPLNLLGQQNIELLEKAGMTGVAVDGHTASGTPEVFKIEHGKYHVIVGNPEVIMQEGGHFKIKAVQLLTRCLTGLEM
ncbi:hypothetical protein NEOLEDRAFT_721112 [Neolentinus lepideus HHB14362 ss-1]|uniref:Helicase ATP-binding domain-containing protein n=1 Tax=Neolentinus lepideus HHB14362 ss-1 TaxID=1314782 RepID=A0A165Q207_9AGAM|nr:hypothetical protein NEOLEDRAFT_721112 [Neolentinus lepideus HHB14362 ss-1]